MVLHYNHRRVQIRRKVEFISRLRTNLLIRRLETVAFVVDDEYRLPLVVLQLSIVFLTLIPLLVAFWLILLLIVIFTLIVTVVVLLLLRPLLIRILFIIAAAKTCLPILLLAHLLRFDRVGTLSLLA